MRFAELFVIRMYSKTRRVQRQSVRIISAMDCAGFWKDLRMITAKRRRRVCFSDGKVIVFRPLD